MSDISLTPETQLVAWRDSLHRRLPEGAQVTDQMRDEGQGTSGKKKIVICCDGTGNKFIDDADADGSNSNVVKLYTTLKIDDRQIGYYHPGVGTADDPRARNLVERFWSRLKGLAFASGFKDNVLDAYQYLMEQFNDGDEVYLIGFSRGAYTVRALAGLLDGYGLLCKGNEGHLPYAWNEYVKQHKNRDQHAVEQNHAFRETFSRKGFRIHFMGVWDTVSSVGWINTPLRLFNVAQTDIIKTGRQAVSIDERRCFYRDNLWSDPTLDKQDIKQPAAVQAGPKDPDQDLLQVWFPGVHSDIGGSYAQDESVLSNEALRWMLQEAGKAGAVIKPEMVNLVLGEEAHGENEEEQTKIGVLRDLYRKPTTLKVHPSLHGIWWLLEVLPHRYYDKDDGEENWRTPLGMHRRIPSGAYLHSSARKLMESNYRYNPPNVRGGVESLQMFQVNGQEEGSIYRYEPPTDDQPLGNKAAVRWAVMIGVSALDVAALLLLGKGVAWLKRAAFR